MITYDEFCSKYRITDDMMTASGLSWDDLTAMYVDFSGKANQYERILGEFQEVYLGPLLRSKADERPVVHSLHSRVKDPEHLIAKAVRKKIENFKKYEAMNAGNYEKFFTDLAGVRCLLLFKADWEKLHKHLVNRIIDDETLYVNDRCLDRFNSDKGRIYHAEAPKVHIRNGDDDRLYLSLLGPEQVSKGRTYRSAHYIIKYKGAYLEIQARTLFEESWGEIDHAVVYPYHTDDPILTEYTGLLNRLTGLADEMASFFVRIQELESENAQPRENQLPSETASGKNGDVTGSVVFKDERADVMVSSPVDVEGSLLSMVESIVRSE